MTGHLCCVTSHTRLTHNTSVHSQLTFIPHLNYLHLNGTDNMVASVEDILSHTHTHWLHREEAWVCSGHVTLWTFIKGDIYKEPRHRGSKDILHYLWLSALCYESKTQPFQARISSRLAWFSIINRWSLSRKLASPTRPPACTHTHTGTAHARAVDWCGEWAKCNSQLNGQSQS